MGQAMDDLIKQPPICHKQPLTFTTVIRHSQYYYGLSFDHGKNSMEATTKNSNWNTGKNTQILATRNYPPSESSPLAQQSLKYCTKNFSFSDDAQLASNRSRIASLANYQANNITNSPVQGAAYAIHGDIMAGVTKRTANSLSFDTLFPTTLTNSEHASIFNKVRSLYGGDNTIQNTADIDAHAETPLFGSDTFTLGDVSTTSEVSSAILGGAQLLKSVPKLASALRDLKTTTLAKTSNINEVKFTSPTLPPIGTILSKQERLKIYIEELTAAPTAKNADEGFKLLDTMMTKVEDAYSGVEAVENPGLTYTGRMYAPRADYTTKLPDGSIEAKTLGNVIRISPDGTINFFIRDKSQPNDLGRLTFTKSGTGK